MEPMTEVAASRANDRFAGIHRKGDGANDCCGYILIFIGIIGLLIAFGSFVIALLANMEYRLYISSEVMFILPQAHVAVSTKSVFIALSISFS